MEQVINIKFTKLAQQVEKQLSSGCNFLIKEYNEAIEHNRYTDTTLLVNNHLIKKYPENIHHLLIKIQQLDYLLISSVNKSEIAGSSHALTLENANQILRYVTNNCYKIPKSKATAAQVTLMVRLQTIRKIINDALITRQKCKKVSQCLKNITIILDSCLKTPNANSFFKPLS